MKKTETLEEFLARKKLENPEFEITKVPLVDNLKEFSKPFKRTGGEVTSRWSPVTGRKIHGGSAGLDFMRRK